MINLASKRNESIFISDTPIKKREEDKFSRKKFSSNLAEAILEYSGDESLVIGVLGKWGSGKTSVINMVLEVIEEYFNNQKDMYSYIRNETNDKYEIEPIVVQFNPWNYSNQNQLISQFFSSLSVALSRVDLSQNLKDIGVKILQYSKIFQSISFIPFVGNSLAIANGIGETMKSIGALKKQDLESLKNEIGELLIAQNQKILIVIDDIDRLNDIEIRQIFQLIKSLADFKNTIYILSFDRKVVVTALNTSQEKNGEEYLEKIVQIPLQIPDIPKTKLQEYLLYEIEEILADCEERYFNKEYWQKIYHAGFIRFFKNMRDIKRYINYLRFNFEPLKNEVNTIDFLVKTAFDVFIPELNKYILQNQNLFIDSSQKDIIEALNLHDKKDWSFERNLIQSELSKYNHYSFLEDLLCAMFPKIKMVFDNEEYKNVNLQSSEMRKECRLCTPDHFEKYFTLTLESSNGSFTQSEIYSLLSLAKDLDSFNDTVLSLIESERIIEFLKIFDDYVQSDDVKEEFIENIVFVLLNQGDNIPDVNIYFLLNSPQLINTIIKRLIFRLSGFDTRFNTLEKLIKKVADSLYTIVHLIGSEEETQKKYKSIEEKYCENQCLVLEQQLNILKSLVCEKIEDWSKSKSLFDVRMYKGILFSWKRWSDGTALEKYLEEQFLDYSILFKFISDFFTNYQLDLKTNDDHDWYEIIETINKLYDVEKIREKLEDFKNSEEYINIDEYTKKVINTFEVAYDYYIKQINKKDKEKNMQQELRSENA